MYKQQVYAAPPLDKGFNGRAALAHAKAACTLTGGADWQSLTALAAAHARLKNFAAAELALSRAAQLAPAEYAGQCAQWQAAIDKRQPLQRDW